ncbi:MAG TPA: YdcF family protein [Caulobacteraceae bacterium]
MNGLFFPLAKLGWAVLAPSHLVLWLALATVIALLAGRARLGRGLAIATALLFIVFGVLPTGDWLARGLENRYPRPAAPPARVDGVVDLGGGLGDAILGARGAPAAALTETRLVSTFELARRYPDARVVFSGGWGRYPDAAAAAYAFAQMGLDPRRLTLESRSRDTFENLAFTQRLVRPKPGEVWVLATSAIQMPRAIEDARRLGWTMIPWPTDYLTAPQGGRRPLADYLDVAGNLGRADMALHEELGLVAYRARGPSSQAKLPPPPPGNATGAAAVTTPPQEAVKP